MKVPFNLSLGLIIICIEAASAQTIISAPAAYQVRERQANRQIWEQEAPELRADGARITHVHKYIELSTGLNHPVNGQWIPSTEEIDVLPDGTAAATNGQHQVYFPADIDNGVIEVVTPDGQHLKSRPLGLFYDDGTNTVLIGLLTNSIGGFAAANQVIYPHAFAGLNADLRYTYRKSGFEQDVILREQPPAPAAFGFNPQTTRLQLLTEFFETADPVQTPAAANQPAGLRDTTLTFGKMKMIRGKAFSIGEAAQSPGGRQVPTGKSWWNLNGR